MRFRKRPVVVEAFQWFRNGDHPDDYREKIMGLEGAKVVSYSPEFQKENNWEGQVVRFWRLPNVAGDAMCSNCGRQSRCHGFIETLEGGHTVCPGDWIITGVQGERYPCKPDIFEKTYEPERNGGEG